MVEIRVLAPSRLPDDGSPPSQRRSARERPTGSTSERTDREHRGQLRTPASSAEGTTSTGRSARCTTVCETLPRSSDFARIVSATLPLRCSVLVSAAIPALADTLRALRRRREALLLGDGVDLLDIGPPADRPPSVPSPASRRTAARPGPGPLVSPESRRSREGAPGHPMASVHASPPFTDVRTREVRCCGTWDRCRPQGASGARPWPWSPRTARSWCS
jgi:hypothetical protein